MAALTGSTNTLLKGVGASTTSVVILIAKDSPPGRFGASIYNDSTAILYLKVGQGPASITSYTLQIGPQQYWETPFGYAGEINGIWVAANGNAYVTEYL